MDGGREEQRRRGEGGGEEDGVDEDEYTEDASEKYGERCKKEDENNEHDKENGDLNNIQGRGASTDAGECRESLFWAVVERTVLDVDTGRSSTGVRKRPNPTSYTPQLNTQVRLTTAYFRSRRGTS